jgi:hypothetical protein
MNLCFKEIVIVPKIDVNNVFFIFRDKLEITVEITYKNTVKSNYNLLPYEMEFIRQNYLKCNQEIIK